MEYDVYFDESGDLGWRLDKPYRKEGSSRYFTIAYLLLPKDDNKHINRFIKKFHKDRSGIEKEIKGASFRNKRMKSTARNMVSLLQNYPSISIGAITVYKPNVAEIIRQKHNENILYDHMVKLALCEPIKDLSSITIIPDKRSVPSGSQNSCSDQLKAHLWLELESKVNLLYQPEESHSNTRLMFIDWIANFIWRSYEDGQQDAYQILKPYLKEQLLFHSD